MKSDGYVKLYRCLTGKPIWVNSSPEHKTLLVVLLTMVNHAGKEWEWKGEKYEVKRGQTITSLESIRKKCGKGVSIQNIRSGIARFKKLGFLTNESTKEGSLITVVNFGIYQGLENKPTKEPTSSQQSANKEPTTNKNDKNVIKKEKDKKEKIPSWMTAKDYHDFVSHKKKNKGSVSERALMVALAEMKKTVDRGYSVQEIIDEYVQTSWQGYKDEWMSKRLNGGARDDKAPVNLQSELPADYMAFKESIEAKYKQ